MMPASAVEFEKLGFKSEIETEAALWKAADIIAKVRVPEDGEMKHLRADQTVIAFSIPVADADKIRAGADKGATVVTMEMIPRITAVPRKWTR
jgi:NAD(P) transhydrogenase subunit alpha